MDFGRQAGFSSGNVGLISVPEIPSSNAFDQWVPGSSDNSIWATEDDYRAWNMGPPTEAPSSLDYDNRPNQIHSGSEPPNKKSRNAQGGDSHIIGNNRSRAIGKMFFKTKLCCKFRAGVCPYITNCNFAHGMEELRKPPSNWQEIMAAREEEREGVTSEPREEHQIPTFSSSDFRGDSLRSFKGRHCKKFYTDEGCPYGDNCSFLHDEQSRVRESVAISLSPTVGGEYGNSGNSGNTVNLKPSNWKTRICNKWETTGHCPFGSKCHFAHGVAELHNFGGGLVEADGLDSSSAPPDSNQVGVPSKTMTDMVVASTISTHTDAYRTGLGVPSQRLASNSGLNQRLGERTLQKWKGPGKISRIYGDWIDDIE